MNFISHMLLIFAAIIFSSGWVLLLFSWISVGIITFAITAKGLKKLLQARK